MWPQERLARDLQQLKNALEGALSMAGHLVDMLLGVRTRLTDDGEMLRLATGANSRGRAAIAHVRLVLRGLTRRSWPIVPTVMPQSGYDPLLETRKHMEKGPGANALRMP